MTFSGDYSTSFDCMQRRQELAMTGFSHFKIWQSFFIQHYLIFTHCNVSLTNMNMFYDPLLQLELERVYVCNVPYMPRQLVVFTC